MFRTVLACLITIAVFSVSTAAGQSIELFLRVPSALPLVNAEQILQARIHCSGKLSTSGEVQFFYRRGDKLEPIGKSHRVEFKPGDTQQVVTQSWRPGHMGEYELLAKLSLAGKNSLPPESVKKTATQKVTAVGRPLHFHYWQLKPELRYVTEGLMNDRKLIDYWNDRGAIPQYWKGGLCYYKDNTCKTAECFAKRWASEGTRIWPGIVIDEAGDGGTIDTVLGKALVESKKLWPDIYIALYVISPGKGEYLANYRKAADRVLVETYTSHAGYGYKRIASRYQEAVDGGLGHKSLAVLGLGKFGITTSQELRRQLHFVRYRFPHSSGIAFFGSMEPLYPEMNKVIKRFFIEPVLRVETTDKQRLRVENIGAIDAPATVVSLGGNQGNTHPLGLKALAVGKSREVDMPPGCLQPISNYKGNVLVLADPLLWDKEPAMHRPGATAKWPVLENSSKCFEDNFKLKPALLFTKTPDSKKKADQITATYELPGETHDRFEVDFDLETARVWFYSSIGMGLTNKSGDSSLNLSLYRGDYEKANYFWLTYQAPNQPAVSERLALPIESKRNYRIKLFCQNGKFMRMAVLDCKSGKKLWDTGDIPIYGQASFDRLRLSAKNGEVAKLEWDEQRGVVLLRGSMSKQYVTSAYLDNLSVTGLKGRVKLP